ncbi:hypothetical protein [Actinocorallia longicatena]|uniref:Uncharacterized protein n=1 Tax=Actinocorallia longicatena TaxID=111803 RepID=A0ABP6QA66_9ACTN
MDVRARGFAIAAAVCGVGTAGLVVALGHPVLSDLMRDGGFLSWMCASFLSACFVAAVLAVLGSMLLDRGWCWPGWMVAGIYMTTLVAAFSARAATHGGSALVVGFSLYCTSIPFQLALLTRRLTVGAPTGPSVVERLLLPGARGAEHDRLDVPALRR